MTEPTLAQQNAAERAERGRRWWIVIKAINRGEYPVGTTPDDFDWTEETP